MLKKANYLWRLLATGFSFVVFGSGGLVLSATVIPLVLFSPFSKEKKRDHIRLVVSLTFKSFFWMMHYLGLLTYRVYGKEVIRTDRSCLVIANHPSLIDVVSLISLYPNACCIVKKELFSNFFVKRVLRGAGYIPNDEPEALLQDCQESIDRGDVLIIFPEGTRTVPGQEMVLQRGAAHIALRLKCPLRTIQIQVEPPTLTKNLPWYVIPARRVDFTVTIKDILEVKEYIENNTPFSLASRRLTNKIRENIDIGFD